MKELITVFPVNTLDTEYVQQKDDYSNKCINYLNKSDFKKRKKSNIITKAILHKKIKNFQHLHAEIQQILATFMIENEQIKQDDYLLKMV
jgi:hypothetical protein